MAQAYGQTHCLGRRQGRWHSSWDAKGTSGSVLSQEVSMVAHTYRGLEMNTPNLFINPLFPSSRIEKIKEWELLCELKGESIPVSLLGITTRGP